MTDRENRDPAAERADPGPDYNIESGYEAELEETQAPDRTPEGEPTGRSNEDSREADRKGD